MTITGQFKDVFDNTYSLEIVNSTVSGDNVIIGEHYNQAENDLLYFADEPVELECDMDDMFTEIAMQSATINLLSREFIADKLFADNARSAIVRIWKENNIIFDGYVEAGTYDQPFSEPYDPFTINCVDKLSTLQYYKYKGITPDTLDSVKTSLNTITFRELINLALNPVISDGIIYYDKSKGLTSSRLSNIFDDLKVSEQVFVGDDYDSVWNYEDVLKEMLKYLNLHIRQVGKDFYIFDWDTIKNRKSDWINLSGNQEVTITPSIVRINEENNAGPDTNISIDEVYNQIRLTCELNSEDNVIESPLDTSSLSSPYMNKQHFLREYWCWGTGTSACNAFGTLIHDRQPDYDSYTEVDWYLQWLESKNWKFYTSDGELRTLYEQDSNGEFINQYKISDRQRGTCQPALVGIGSVRRDGSDIFLKSDATGYIKLTNQLVISINGNQNDTPGENYPSSTDIQERQPIAEFLSTSSASVYSPNDDKTTNYLVFSGKFTLVTKQDETGNYDTCVAASNHQEISDAEKSDYAILYGWGAEQGIMQLYRKTVQIGESDDRKYYTRKWYHLEYPNNTVNDYTPYVTYGLMPVTEDINKKWEYNYSAPWNSDDTIDNLDILECELIIGNKRLVQYYPSGSQKAVLEWVTVGNEPRYVFPEDGSYYTITTFQLGINPKKGDKIIGSEFDIRSTVDFSMNIDADGFAVPIKKSDNLTGQVLFRILGPVNTKWNDITRRHPTFFRSTKYYDNWHYILAHLENITIKEFKCQLMSDNAGYNTNYKDDDKDLIYLSNEQQNYVNVKDDITFKFITQPTTQEAITKGIKTDLNYNAVLKASDGGLVSTIWNNNSRETYKPEEHYVCQYYLQYNSPKVVLDVDLWSDSNVNYWNTFRYNQLNRDFIVRSMTRTLHDNKTHLKLTEI